MRRGEKYGGSRMGSREEGMGWTEGQGRKGVHKKREVRGG